MNSYFSPWMAYNKRKVFQDQEPWLRKEDNTFQYGYFYAQMLTVFAICIFFSSLMPLITVATVFFMFVRHAVDLLNLLTVFGKEIDSQGRFIDEATNTAFFYVVIYQVCMIVYLWARECEDESILCTFIFLCSIVYINVGYEAVNDFKQMTDANVNKHGWSDEELENLLRQWRQEYDHPSVVTKSRRVHVLKT